MRKNVKKRTVNARIRTSSHVFVVLLRCWTDNLWTVGSVSLFLCCHCIAEWLTLTNAVHIPPSQTTGSGLTIAAESWRCATPRTLQRILLRPVEVATKGYRIIRHRGALRDSTSAQNPERWGHTSVLEK